MDKKDLSKLSLDEIRKLKYSDNTDEKTEYNEQDVKKLREKANDHQKLTQSEAKILHQDDANKATKEFDQVIRGYNDQFVKHYSFAEDKVNFTIKINMPNIIDTGKVEALRDHYLDGTSFNQSMFTFNAFDALALIRICGVDVPVELAKDENIFPPAMEWLNQIDKDYAEWERRFHA